jgi:hypothetical protein
MRPLRFGGGRSSQYWLLPFPSKLCFAFLEFVPSERLQIVVEECVRPSIAFRAGRQETQIVRKERVHRLAIEVRRLKFGALRSRGMMHPSVVLTRSACFHAGYFTPCNHSPPTSYKPSGPFLRRITEARCIISYPSADHRKQIRTGDCLWNPVPRERRATNAKTAVVES